MKLKRFEEYSTVNEASILNHDFGTINIHITGNGWIKNVGADKIQQAMKGLQGERHIFVDGDEVGVHGSQRPIFGHKSGF